MLVWVAWQYRIYFLSTIQNHINRISFQFDNLIVWKQIILSPFPCNEAMRATALDFQDFEQCVCFKCEKEDTWTLFEITAETLEPVRDYMSFKSLHHLFRASMLWYHRKVVPLSSRTTTLLLYFTTHPLFLRPKQNSKALLLIALFLFANIATTTKFGEAPF